MKTARINDIQGSINYYACMGSSMIVLMTVLVVTFVAVYSGSMDNFGFNDDDSSKLAAGFKIPLVELQTKLMDSRESNAAGDIDDDRIDHFRAVSSDYGSSNSSPPAVAAASVIVIASNQTVIAKKYGRLEQGLAQARSAIRKASSGNQNLSAIVPDENCSDILTSNIYRNPSAFYQSYLEMEKRFKVYVYEEGELPIVHSGPCKDIYSIEGRFITEMEQGKGKKFRTKDGQKAHVYFLPFSVAWMVKYLYKPLTYDVTPLKDFVSDYVKVISTKHPFWNRTQAADHFMLSCHDWGPQASKGNPDLYNTSIRVLCNANSSEGFNAQKDVSLPEVYLYAGAISSKHLSPPPPNIPRQHLAFFAGGVHGPVRPILLHHWQGRDKDLQVFEYLPEDLDYYSFMLNSRYCLCPSGYEVASPRIVESIYSECVPVILSDHYVLPFSDVLRWEAFSIQVEVSDISRLKDILSAVPEEKYLSLKEGVRAVKKHFWLNHPAKRFDVFHMILHSVWLRRLNLRLS